MLDYIEFPYKPPEGHSYETKHFTSNILSIWLHHPNIYSYTSDRVSTIWGFFNTKTRQYHAPITSTKCGDKVDVSQTTAYSAIIPKYNPLEVLLYSGEN